MATTQEDHTALQTLRDWAEDVRQQHGKLTPAIVRDAARPKDSPAHGFVFGISQKEAAEAYYLDRAHKLIQTVRIIVRDSPEEPPRRVRFYYAVRGDEGEAEYVPANILVQKPDLFAQARAAAIGRVRDAESAVSDLDTLAGGKHTAALDAIRSARLDIEAA